MNHSYEQLSRRYTELGHFQHVISMMQWDESVNMPAGGAASRAAALSTLSGCRHEIKTQAQIADEIKACKELSLTQWQRRNLELIEKEYIKSTILPVSLVQRMTAAALACKQQWRVSRAQNDWASLKPILEESFNLIKEAAERQSDHFQCSSYDVLLDEYMPGVNQAIIDPLFAELESQLPERVSAIMAHQNGGSVQPLKGTFEVDRQKKLSEEVMSSLGFDFNHGRLDETLHPFCGGVPEDVRVTTRYNDQDVFFSLMAVCHETGHALYEQGLPESWRFQPVGQALGMAVHESQSLFVEMQLCRSLPFYQWCCPIIEKYIGAQPGLTAENIFKLNTLVKPSLIRITADEVTYPLHVILRYQIEKKLFSGEMTVHDLPAYWNEMMHAYLGLKTEGNDADGVMQDVHWPSGAFGYFPAYTLGRLIAAQLFEVMERVMPDALSRVAQGEFQPIMLWLRDQVHQYGSRLSMNELVMQATGSTLSTKPFLNHLQSRYLG